MAQTKYRYVSELRDLIIVESLTRLSCSSLDVGRCDAIAHW